MGKRIAAAQKYAWQSKMYDYMDIQSGTVVSTRRTMETYPVTTEG